MKVTIATKGLLLGMLCLMAAHASAQDTAQPEFDYQRGDIQLPNKIATLHLGEAFRYLNPAETEKLLVAWGNPPGNETQGSIIPRDVDPMSETGWAVIVTYEDEGALGGFLARMFGKKKDAEA